MPVNGIGSADTTTYRLERMEAPAEKTEFDSVLRSATQVSAGDLEGIFQAAASRYGVPVNLLKAVAKVESNFNPNATSRCGAMGVMQLMPRTAQGLGVNDAYDAQENIMGGAKYLSQMLRRYSGDTSLALAAYNAGPGRVNQTDGVPSFAQGYVNKVMKYYGNGASVLPTGTDDGAGALKAATQSSGIDQLATMLYLYQLLRSNSLGGGSQDDQTSIL